jgi:hypothetical protein
MAIDEYDLIRSPFVRNEAFFLESKCAFRGLLIFARSINELVEQEKLHRTKHETSTTAA